MKLLIVSGLLIVLVMGILAHNSNASTAIRLATLPLAFFAMLFAYDAFTDKLGRPLYERPNGEFRYVFHVERGDTVELVAADDISSRLYIFNATKEEREKLGKAKSDTGKGVPVEGKFIDGPKGSMVISDGELEFWPVIEVSKEDR